MLNLQTLNIIERFQAVVLCFTVKTEAAIFRLRSLFVLLLETEKLTVSW